MSTVNDVLREAGKFLSVRENRAVGDAEVRYKHNCHCLVTALSYIGDRRTENPFDGLAWQSREAARKLLTGDPYGSLIEVWEGPGTTDETRDEIARKLSEVTEP